MGFIDADRLTRIFAATLTPLFAGGCGPKIDEDQFSYEMCENASAYTMLDSVVPVDEVDYLELRAAQEFSTTSTVLDAFGQACTGAADAQACADALAALDPLTEFVQGGGFDLPTYQLLAFTRADEVGAVRDHAQLESFLGTIDSPGDAALFAMLSGQVLNCGPAAEVGDHADGFVLYTTTGSGCGSGDDVEHHVVLVHEDGAIEVLETELIERGDPGCAIGRMPAGLCRRRVAPAGSPVGRFLAEVANLEAASVPAFDQLARELIAHGAPTSMIQAALRARADEVRHARTMGTLARAYGGQPRAPEVRATGVRSLEALAEDNAIEGCVRETYGALVAHVQARRARSVPLRRAFTRIAADETAHAALSWRFAAWADARLPASARTRVARRRAAAVERLRVELTAPLHPTVHSELGMPHAREARALFDRLERALERRSV